MGAGTFRRRAFVIALGVCLLVLFLALAALNAEYKVCAMYHTHSGVDLVGAPVWDIFEILKSLDPAAIEFRRVGDDAPEGPAHVGHVVR